MQALGSFTILLFDIDGVIRDVAGSYRRALQETVAHYSGWRPDASDIDRLKAEGAPAEHRLRAATGRRAGRGRAAPLSGSQ
mgnify:CR=1 FL=1